MAAIITVNGVELPCPTGGLEQIITDAVNDGRNSNGEMIGERVGRTQVKLNNLEWKWLTPEQTTQILQLFSDFFVIVKFYSLFHGDWVTLKMYPGDRTAETYYMYEDGHPTRIMSLKVNIIDCGIL